MDPKNHADYKFQESSDTTYIILLYQCEMLALKQEESAQVNQAGLSKISVAKVRKEL